MIRIDGAQGEGGGQVLRCALTLGAICGTPVHIRGIRARRKVPGLQAQHLTAVRALVEICGAEAEGAVLGSQELTFTPGRIRPGEYDFEIGTAGSVSLVLQAILLPLAMSDGASRVTVTGGTHVPWSPPTDYLQKVLFPALARMGVQARLDVERWGFFPRGGGRVRLEIEGSAALSALTLIRQPGGEVVRGMSAVARLPRSVAERQRARARERLDRAGYSGEIAVREVDALDPGSFLWLDAESETACAGFSGLGDRGKSAESVSDDVVERFLEFAGTDAGCDPHLADQLIVPTALAAGTSRLTTSRVTSHLLTTIALAQQILGCPVQMDGGLGEPGSVTIEGLGWHHESAQEGSGPPSVSAAGCPGHDVPSRAFRPPSAAPSSVVRKARADDGPSIQRMLAHFSARGELLPRTLNEVYKNLRDFFVCEVDGEVVGVCALSLYWEDLAEIRSLAVHETYGGRGLGKALVAACLDEAAGLGVRRVFALTYRPGFFERLGFRTLDKQELPQKIWKDCIRCAKFTCCDETALICDTTPAGRAEAPPLG
jgi:RNA 3'-terminal phosphate cyclase (ATP)